MCDAQALALDLHRRECRMTVYLAPRLGMKLLCVQQYIVHDRPGPYKRCCFVYVYITHLTQEVHLHCFSVSALQSFVTANACQHASALLLPEHEGRKAAQGLCSGFGAWSFSLVSGH